MGYQKFFSGGDVNDLAAVVAFDPGGTTGWCVMAVHPDVLVMGTSEGDEPTGIGERKPLWDTLDHVEYGQIDCDPPGFGLSQMHNGHPGLSFVGENNGVRKMVSLCDFIFPKSAIVLEDFIIDFKKITQARDALSPVRITSAFSYGLSQQELVEGDSIQRIHIQNRSLAKTTCTDIRLRHWNLYDSASGAHARDATRHAYYFLRDRQGKSVEAAEKRWRAWPHLFDDPQVRPAQNRREKQQRALGERI